VNEQPQETESEEPHDVLAAEEFPLGEADPDLRHGPLELPPDLTGSEQPRDVLAAEEFAVPATAAAAPGPDDLDAYSGSGTTGVQRLLFAAAVAAIVLWLLRRRRGSAD
jgi:hypothetical protein